MLLNLMMNGFGGQEMDMRIATYNIWDSDAGMPARFEQIIEEITKVDADILCLQEVADREKHDRIAELSGYSCSHWHKQAGLSIMSRFPIEDVFTDEFAAFACIAVEGRSVMTVNVHLPWDRISARERSIVAIVNRMSEINADYAFLAGDFNSAAGSSVHRFLRSEQSLLGADAYFFDLADVSAEINGVSPPATMNFRENPRWGAADIPNTLEINQRFDWIMLKNPYPMKMPILKACTIFGMKASSKTGLAASDHYGVAADMEF